MSPALPHALCVFGLLALSAACASSPEPHAAAAPQGEGASPPSPREALRNEYVLADDVRVTRVARGVWIHTTLGSGAYHRYPANGLVIEDGASTTLVDTGWSTEQAERLLTWAEDELRRPVKAAVVTHFHNDRTGGVPSLIARKIPVYGLIETSRLATARGEPTPSHTFAGARTLGAIELFFPGAGHSPDNLVVWHPESRTLFGGCFVKDASAEALGNVADADTNVWPESLEKVRARFPEPTLVVPGHGPPGGPALLLHTQSLLRGAAAESSGDASGAPK